MIHREWIARSMGFTKSRNWHTVHLKNQLYLFRLFIYFDRIWLLYRHHSGKMFPNSNTIYPFVKFITYTNIAFIVRKGLEIERINYFKWFFRELTTINHSSLNVLSKQTTDFLDFIKEFSGNISDLHRYAKGKERELCHFILTFLYWPWEV